MTKVHMIALIFLLSAAALRAELVAHWSFADGTYNDQAGSLTSVSVGTVSVADVTETNVPFQKAIQTALYIPAGLENSTTEM